MSSNKPSDRLSYKSRSKEFQAEGKFAINRAFIILLVSILVPAIVTLIIFFTRYR